MSESEQGLTPSGEASPNRPDSEDREADPPVANPDLDMDDEDNNLSDDDDNDSLLSEVDEAEFADFDPTTVALEDRPAVNIDEDVAKTLKAGKRKRADGEKKSKEARRDRPKKKKARRDDDEDPDGQQLDGKRVRKPKADGERKERTKERKRTPEPENEDNLTPEERRRRALDRAMDAALKNPNKRRRKKNEEDLEEAMDDEIAALKIRMEQACEADNTAREQGKPATHKLAMLPEVTGLMNRNTVRHSIVDPDTNFLQSVKFFLEPLNDGSLPSYKIQRDLFAALASLPIEKEALLSSGIGKVVHYYTKSKRPEVGIKRIAERLMGEWSRPILKRSDDYKQRKVTTKDYDHVAAALALRPGGMPSSQMSSQRGPALSQRELERERVLAQPIRSNRARMQSSNASYTVAPRSTFDASRGPDPLARPIGAGGMDAFRRMTAKQGKKRS